MPVTSRRSRPELYDLGRCGLPGPIAKGSLSCSLLSFSRFIFRAHVLKEEIRKDVGETESAEEEDHEKGSMECEN